jgi:hypothetical protein
MLEKNIGKYKKNKEQKNSMLKVLGLLSKQVQWSCMIDIFLA